MKKIVVTPGIAPGYPQDAGEVNELRICEDGVYFYTANGWMKASFLPLDGTQASAILPHAMRTAT